MNTQSNTQREAFERFAQVTVQRRRLTRSHLELQILPFAVRATSPQLELPHSGTAPRASYFVEVYVARPVSRVPGGTSARVDPLLKPSVPRSSVRIRYAGESRR